MLLFVSCGEFHRTGDLDYYYEEGYTASSLGTSHLLVYSRDFIKKFENLNFEFHHYLNSFTPDTPLGEYDLSIITITYDATEYELAKNDLFENTEYISKEPNYTHNSYDFYIMKTYYECGDWLFLNAFCEDKKVIVLMGFYRDPTTNINLDVPEDEWPEFLRTYFGEYYDFDA